MSNTITVEIIDDNTEEVLSVSRWIAVPNVGEQFSTGRGHYEVVFREWGVTTGGDGQSYWDNQYASLRVTLAKGPGKSVRPGPLTNREHGLVCGECNVFAEGATRMQCFRPACPGKPDLAATCEQDDAAKERAERTKEDQVRLVTITNMIKMLEKQHFRSVADSGNSPQGMVIMNSLRAVIEMPPIGPQDFPQRDDEGVMVFPPDSKMLLAP